MGRDLKEIAALLQSKGRGKDKLLAHITPEEAYLLKSRGGSGTTHPETGLLEFDTSGMSFDPTQTYTDPTSGGGGGYGVSVPQDVSSSFGYSAPTDTSGGGGSYSGGYTGSSYSPSIDTSGFSSGGFGGGTTSPQTTYGSSAADMYGFGGLSPQTMGSFQSTPSTGAPPATSPDLTNIGNLPTGALASATGTQASSGNSLSDLASALGTDVTGALNYLNKYPMLGRLLGAGVQGLVGYNLLNKQNAYNQQQAQALQKIGQPYTQQGNAMAAAAIRGELTPANQQTLQAARAIAEQNAASRGNVGQAQIANQMENITQSLLQNQLMTGLQTAQIGNQYTQQGILTGIQSSNQLSGSMSNLLGSLGGGVGYGLVPAAYGLGYQGGGGTAGTKP